MIDDKLFMSFDPNTIQHLGIKMYSNLPAALAEDSADGGKSAEL